MQTHLKTAIIISNISSATTAIVNPQSQNIKVNKISYILNGICVISATNKSSTCKLKHGMRSERKNR